MLIYLHGFNSAPASHKAQVLARDMAGRGLEKEFVCPALSHHPDAAIGQIEDIIANHAGEPITLIGSSLGGFYATWLAERHGLKAVLLNPAVHPERDLRAYLGTQKNLFTGAEYELTERHLSLWAGMYPPVVTPTRYLLIVETGDELLDYREAEERYAGARQIVIEGGDHTLQSFPQHIPAILQFAGLLT